MARPLRIEWPGSWYHLTNRGNARRRIFRDDRDRHHFLDLLAELVTRHRLEVHSYVLMDNHYHLLVRLREPNLSVAMQWLGVSYSAWFNRRHRLTGHLFQGRFTGVLIEEARVPEISRYVHLNPVRVGSVGLDKAGTRREKHGQGKRPETSLVAERLRRLRSYRWSSYRAYVGLDARPAWLTSDTVLGLSGGEHASRRYATTVEQAIQAGTSGRPWDDVQAQLALGGAAFVERVRELARGDAREQPSVRALLVRPGWEEVVQAVERVRGERWWVFRDRHGDWGRDLALYVARRHCGLGLKALAERAGGLDYASAATAIARFKTRLAKDAELRAHCDQVVAQLSK